MPAAAQIGAPSPCCGGSQPQASTRRRPGRAHYPPIYVGGRRAALRTRPAPVAEVMRMARAV